MPEEPVDPEGPVARVETAVSPVIRAEAVHIPTPAWGVAIPERIDADEREPVDGVGGQELDALEDIPEVEWVPASRRWPGWLALALAVTTAVLTAVGVSLDSAHHSDAATVIAWVAIGTSVAAFVVGLVAAVLNRGRTSAVLGALVGAFANPWVLLQVLTLLHG